MRTYWFNSEDKAYANYRNAKALGQQASMMYDHYKDMWRVRIW